MKEDNKELLEVIRRCGLDESEAKVYLALLTLGNGTVHQVAKESGLNRTSSYAVIERLKRKGFISNIKKVGKIYLSPINPQRFLQIQKENYANLERHIDDLNYLFTIAQKSPGVRFYEGKEGLKTVLEMIIEEAEEISIYGDGDAFKHSIPGWSEYYSGKRAARNIKSRLLLRGTSDAIETVRKLRRNPSVKNKLSKIRVLPEGYNIVGGFDVYNEKVIFYSFSGNNTAVVVESAIISAMMLSIFNMLWDMAEVYDKTLLNH
ncbi:hypothetical protein KGQ29_01500 [Patescibacteria group bacterium]|nr:hypothetical protein [Patescibacteria group bacterium]